MTDRPESTRVNIYGREYSIRGDGDPTYVAEIAHFVDMRMREMTDNITMASTSKVAILAALNITDELFRLEKSLDEDRSNQARILNSLAERIENALNRGGAHTPRPATREPAAIEDRVVTPSSSGNASGEN
jgi:cell division protein ZapA